MTEEIVLPLYKIRRPAGNDVEERFSHRNPLRRRLPISFRLPGGYGQTEFSEEAL